MMRGEIESPFLKFPFPQVFASVLKNIYFKNILPKNGGVPRDSAILIARGTAAHDRVAVYTP